jgi:hypothetical protein
MIANLVIILFLEDVSHMHANSGMLKTGTFAEIGQESNIVHVKVGAV